MEEKLTQAEKFTRIANALRSRGHSGDIVADEFYSKIKQLPRLTPYARQDLPWCGSAANQAVAVARSYWDARISSKRAFTYSGGKTFYNTDKDGPYPVNDENGNGLIDCSTFIRLVLSGVDYLHSPYVTGKREDGAPRKDLYSWANEDLDANDVRYAADLAEYFFLTGRVLDGFEDLRPGDIIFHATPGSITNRFMCISHVSIVAEEGYHTADGVAYYNVTSDSNNCVVIRSGWGSRDDYVFVARPNYEPARSYPALDENINLLMPPWYSVPKTIKGCTMSVSADGKSMTAVGTPTESVSFTLISGDHPMYLLPGSYKLSGAPARADVTGGYTWGLVVRDSRTNTDYGWDFGNGADFKLDEITPVKVYIYISSSKSPDGYVWTPRLTGKETV